MLYVPVEVLVRMVLQEVLEVVVGVLHFDTDIQLEARLGLPGDEEILEDMGQFQDLLVYHSGHLVVLLLLVVYWV